MWLFPEAEPTMEPAEVERQLLQDQLLQGFAGSALLQVKPSNYLVKSSGKSNLWPTDNFG